MSIIVNFPLPFMTCAFTLLSLQQGLWLLSRQPMTCDCDLSQGAEPGGLRKLHCACPRGSEKADSKETNSRWLCTNRCTARCASNCPLDIFPSHLTYSAFTCYSTCLRLQLEVLERKDVKVEAPRTTPLTLLSCVESTGQDALVLAANIQETPKNLYLPYFCGPKVAIWGWECSH